MAKKKSTLATKEPSKAAMASKQSLDDFVANWSDDDDDENDAKVVNGARNGTKKKVQNGHKVSYYLPAFVLATI